MAETPRVIQDYIGASEANRIRTLQTRINAHCEAKDAVIAELRKVDVSLLRKGAIFGFLDEDAYAPLIAAKAAIAALDALPQPWQDDTAKMRAEDGDG